MIPDFQSIMLPLLKSFNESEIKSLKELRFNMVNNLGPVSIWGTKNRSKYPVTLVKFSVHFQIRSMRLCAR